MNYSVMEPYSHIVFPRILGVGHTLDHGTAVMQLTAVCQTELANIQIQESESN